MRLNLRPVMGMVMGSVMGMVARSRHVKCLVLLGLLKS